MLAAIVSASAGEPDPHFYVLSTITAKPGKLEAIHALLQNRLIPQTTKLGVTNRALASLFAAKHGLITTGTTEDLPQIR